MSKEAKRYLRALLEYAEGFDGFQEVLIEKFGASDMDEARFEEFLEKMGELSSEIHTFLEEI